MPTNTIDVEVRYKETDAMGVVHHSNYLVWFELARTSLCRLSGYAYHEIEKSGYQILVTAARLDYRMPARYGDTVQVTCSMDQLTSRTMRFRYAVDRAGERLVNGTTEHVWISGETGRFCRIPEPQRTAFAKLLAPASTGADRPN